MRIFHLTTPDVWEPAQQAEAHQVEGVRTFWFDDLDAVVGVEPVGG